VSLDRGRSRGADGQHLCVDTFVVREVLQPVCAVCVLCEFVCNVIHGVCTVLCTLFCAFLNTYTWFVYVTGVSCRNLEKYLV